jgi:hypothetical protein
MMYAFLYTYRLSVSTCVEREAEKVAKKSCTMRSCYLHFNVNIPLNTHVGNKIWIIFKLVQLISHFRAFREQLILFNSAG